MWTIIEAFIGLTWWLSDKESACNAGDLGMIPGLGRYPGGENGYPLQYTRLENSMVRGAWEATVHGVAKELDMTEQLNNNHHTELVTILLLFNTAGIEPTPTG